MNTRDFYFNSNLHKLISSDLTNNMLNHSYLVSSSDEIIRKEFAMYLAKEIFCNKNDSPCDNCVSCNKINHNNMVDLKIFPIHEKSLVVEDINGVVEDSYVKPIESDYKVYILNDFDNCTVQGQNKLLKTLEEPPNNVIFILGVSNINKVLPTIQSRCKKIFLNSLSAGEISAYLKDEKIQDGDVLAGMANGNLSLALKLAKNTNIKAIIDVVYDVLLNFRSSSDLLKYSSKILSFKKDIPLFLNTFLIVLHDICSFRNGGEISFKKEDIYKNLSMMYSNEIIENIMKKLCEVGNKLDFNCNIVGVVDKFLLDFLEVKFLCQK